MKYEKLLDLLGRYDIQQPEIIFLRHNENRTYCVNDRTGKSYLLRIHDPFIDEMKGLQHTYGGVLGELQMLEKLGLKIAELHTFFRQYEHLDMKIRPSQGRTYNERMIRVIHSGVHKNLFALSDANVIEQTLQLINSRLDDLGGEESPDLIHGDLSMGNIIITTEGEVRFIDFGFFGTGYALLDVAMGAMMLPSDRRDTFLKGYYRERENTANNLLQLEGFMLVAIIGYYVFQMENKHVHAWMRERMPKLCTEYCRPFLNGERIFYKV